VVSDAANITKKKENAFKSAVNSPIVILPLFNPEELIMKGRIIDIRSGIMITE
jgi:hypothetical protein